MFGDKWSYCKRTEECANKVADMLGIPRWSMRIQFARRVTEESASKWYHEFIAKNRTT